MFTKNGVEINADAFIEYKETRYPPGWLNTASTQQLEELGIKYEPDKVRFDDRFFWDGDPNMPRKPADVRINMIVDVRRQAALYLELTDWMVIRRLESGKELSESISQHRSLIRGASNEFVKEIESCLTTRELSLLQFKWPVQSEPVLGPGNSI